MTVRLALPAVAGARLQRLLAPSVSAPGGVTLAGQTLDADASWRGRYRAEVITPGAGDYPVSMSPFSAALLSVPVTRSR